MSLKGELNVKKTTKPEKTIFVIMPFVSTPMRNKSQLTAFFEHTLKGAIEKHKFKNNYTVTRSDDTFNITEKIVQDIYEADIVICDLSGTSSNPNVMYELGLRVSLTNKPVILIREMHKDNKAIFDISGFHAELYDPLNTGPIVTYIVNKISKFETNVEKYTSPVLNILKKDIPLLTEMSRFNAVNHIALIEHNINELRRYFGGALHSYLSDNSITFDIGTQADKILDAIIKDEDNFDNIDFSKFTWSFGSAPTVDYYISSQFLNNIIDFQVAGYFTIYLLSYQMRFLRYEQGLNYWNPRIIYVYFGETKFLLEMLTIIKGLLNTPPHAVNIENARKVMNEYLDKSNIIN